MSADGAAGGVLFVSDYPGKQEDSAGRPFVGQAGAYLRRTIKTFYDGPCAFDNGLRCYVGKRDVNPNHIGQCRGYLRQTIKEAKPKRIVVMGNVAVQSIFGDSPGVLSVRRAAGWLYNRGDMIPVFILMNPVNALRNRFLRKWFESDLERALTCDIDKLIKPPHTATCRLVTTKQESEEAVEQFYKQDGLTYDTETAGRPFEDFFRVLCLAAVGYDLEQPWVWDFEALQDPDRYKPLQHALEDPDLNITGQNVKYDNLVMRASHSTVVSGVDVDTRLMRKALFSDVNASLEVMSYLVGMGGHKREAQQELVRTCKAISNARSKANKAKAVGLLPGVEDPCLEAAVRYPQHDVKAYAFGLIKRDVLLRYCALDALSTDRMRRWQLPILYRVKPVRRIWSKIIQNATPAVEQMEAWGAPADRQAMLHYERYLKTRIDAIEKRFSKYKADPNSSDQMRELLFEKLALPSTVETNTGGKSTDKEALNNIKDKHPIVGDLLVHRQLTKLHGTYAVGLVGHIRADGRIHPQIKIDGTRSGRPSC
jgi:uracil-DNA glycosylase family 4